MDQNVEGLAGFIYEIMYYQTFFIVLRYVMLHSDNRFHEVLIRTVNTCVMFTSNNVEILKWT